MTDQTEQPKVILLVDDELPFRQIYKDALRGESNYQIVEAEDGEEALAAVKQQPPDLILLDLILPKMSGFDVLTQLKNNPDYQNIPIIVYSVMGGEADIDRAMKLGADDFTIKGFTPAAEVIAKVKKLVGV